jgi:hypothetical protein
MADLRIDIASVFSGAKAFKQADNATAKLTGSVKKLAGAVGLAFGARAIVQFASSSVKAFAEAEKANIRLANSIKNLGLSLSTADIQKKLDEISAKTGIAGETLAAAYQSLLTTTGSVVKTQELFNQALDISAGSGIELGTVTQDLANAYVGITKGLKKYNLGLTQAQLKSKTFAELTELLNKQFSGANAAYLETYAGKMGILAEAAGEAKEIIGQGLIDALLILSGDTTVADLAESMKNVAKETSKAITNIAQLANNLFGAFKPIYDLLQGIYGVFEWLDRNLPKGLLEADDPKPTARRFFAGGQDSVKAGQAAAAERLARQRAAALAAAAAALLKSQKAALKLQQDQLKLKKAGTLFDLEQIGIIAALKGQISDDERKRLELQLAILTGNSAEASILAGKLAYSQGLTKEMVAYLKDLPDAKNPFSAWKSYLDAIEAQVRRIALEGTGGLVVANGATGGGMEGAIPGSTQVFPGDFGDGGAAGAPVSVVVMLDGQELTNAITNVQTNNSLSGRQITINRRTGTFATI